MYVPKLRFTSKIPWNLGRGSELRILKHTSLLKKKLKDLRLILHLKVKGRKLCILARRNGRWIMWLRDGYFTQQWSEQTQEMTVIWTTWKKHMHHSLLPELSLKGSLTNSYINTYYFFFLFWIVKQHSNHMLKVSKQLEIRWFVCFWYFLLLPLT